MQSECDTLVTASECACVYVCLSVTDCGTVSPSLTVSDQIKGTQDKDFSYSFSDSLSLYLAGAGTQCEVQQRNIADIHLREEGHRQKWRLQQVPCIHSTQNTQLFRFVLYHSFPSLPSSIALLPPSRFIPHSTLSPAYARYRVTSGIRG